MKAYSKINIGLKIYKKEKNESKHRIDSIFVLYKKLYDKIKISKSDKLQIRYFFDNDPVLIENCLVEKTLNWLKDKYKANVDFKIKIFKKIPIGSGIGGGSSDAASILLYACKKNKIVLTKKDYKEIALNLGSDIPFFLSQCKTARVSEYGNEIEKLEKIKNKINLYLPNINNPTKRIFELLEKDKNYSTTVDIKKMYDDLKYRGIIPTKECNELTPYILNKNQELIEYYNSIENGIFTGSGSGIIVIE